MFVKIVQVFPITSRAYTDRLGNNQVFYSKGMIIDGGEGTMYVEAVQEQAQELEKAGIKQGECAFVQLGYVARPYKAQNGDERYSNEITIKRFI